MSGRRRGRKQAAPRRSERIELQLSQRTALGLLLAVHLASAVAYRAMAPHGVGPDEGSHGLFLATLAGDETPRAGWRLGLPVFSTEPDDANFELHQPPLYYLLALPGFRIAGPAGAALVSLLASLLTVWLVWRLIGAVAAPDLALAGAAVAALLPMQCFMATRVSNDPLAAAWWTSALWCWVLAIRDGPTPRGGLLAGLAVGAALLTKQNSLVLLPLALLAATLAARRWGWRPAARSLAVCLAVAALLAGWWYLRNAAVYGDLLAQRAFDARFLHPAAGRATPESLQPVLERLGVGYWSYVFDWTARTFVIYIGHGFERLPAAVTSAHLWLTALCAGASAWVLARRRRLGLDPPTAAALLLLAGMVLVTLVFIRFNQTYFQAQGRYLHVMLPGWALMYTAGPGRLPPAASPARRYLLAAAPLWFGLLNLLILTVYLPGLFEEVG